ncbi:MAG: hypothetical protein KatS3mg115_0844 [Candidatus Poribacteria bacterium]|nr:MAG: hypothetical protein KatS3mg115_0844 [Candidatus Poribacteria bacterium]
MSYRSPLLVWIGTIGCFGGLLLPAWGEWLAVEGRSVRLIASEAYRERAEQVVRWADEAVVEFQERFGVSWSGRLEWVFLPESGDVSASWPRWPWAAWFRATPQLSAPLGSEEALRVQVRRSVARRLLEELLRPTWPSLWKPSQRVPDWFLEGVVVYFAGPLPHEDEVLLRGASLDNRLIPLDQLADLERASNPSLARAEAANAIQFLVDEHSEAKLTELLQATISDPLAFSQSFQRVLGISLKDWQRRWGRAIRRRYWPLIESKSPPEELAKPLELEGVQAVYGLAWSPSGEVLACLVRTNTADAVWLIGAKNGARLQEVARLDRAAGSSLETRGAPLFWTENPDRILWIEVRDGRPYWTVADVITARRVVREPLPFEAAWSPVRRGEIAAVIGRRNGRTDLYVRRGQEPWTPITQDGNPKPLLVAGPDANELLFLQEENGALTLWRWRVWTGQIESVSEVDAKVYAVVPLSGGRLLFTADWETTRDLYLLEEDSVVRLAGFLVSVETIAVSPDERELAFTVGQPGKRHVVFLLSLHRANREPVAVPQQEYGRMAAAPKGEVSTKRADWKLDFLGGGLRLETPEDGELRTELAGEWRSWGRGFSTELRLIWGPRSSPGGAVSVKAPLGPWTIAGTGGLRLDYHRPLTAVRKRTSGFLRLEPVTVPYGTFRLGRALGAGRRLDLEVQAEQIPTPYRFAVVPFEGEDPAREWTVAGRVQLRQDRVVVSPAYGPLAGSRWLLEAGPHLLPSEGWGWSVRGEWRRYLALGTRTTLAVRAVGAGSGGPVPRRFWLGGHRMLRGVPFETESGTRLAVLSVELRLPLISELILSWPVRASIHSVRGVLFSEWAGVWDAGEQFFRTRQTDAGRVLERPLWRMGFGLRWQPWGVPLRWDLSIGYDLNRTTSWTALLRLGEDD